MGYIRSLEGSNCTYTSSLSKYRFRWFTIWTDIDLRFPHLFAEALRPKQPSVFVALVRRCNPRSGGEYTDRSFLVICFPSTGLDYLRMIITILFWMVIGQIYNFHQFSYFCDCFWLWYVDCESLNSRVHVVHVPRAHAELTALDRVCPRGSKKKSHKSV